MSVYIVTGASKGIGLGITEGIIQLGSKVVGLARSESLLKEIQSKHGKDKFEFVTGDITDGKVLDKLVDLAASLGKINGIVHNAGVLGPVESLEKSNIKDIKETFNINLFSVIELTQKTLPHLDKSNGNIVLISSGAAAKAYQGWSSYCLSKAALNMLGGLLAAEHPNISTLSVRPGVVDTDMQVEVRANGPNAMTPEMVQRFQGLKDSNELLPPHVPGLAIAKIITGTIPKEQNGQFVNWDVEF